MPKRIPTEQEKDAKKQTIPWKKFWGELWRLMAPFKKYFSFIVVIIIVTALLDLVNPYLLKLLIDGLSGLRPETLVLLLELIALYLVNAEVSAYVGYLGDRRTLRLLVEVEYYLGLKAQEKLVFLGLGYHERENTGAKIIKIERGVDKISEFLNNVFYEVLPTVFQMIITLGAMFFTNWLFGVSFLVFVPLYVVVTFLANQKMYPVRKQIYRDYETASGKMGQAIMNINAVQSFVQEKRELSEYEKIKAHIRDNENKQWGWMMRIGLVRNFITDIGRVSVLLLGVYLVYKNLMTVGTLVFAFTLSEKAYASLFRLSRFYDRSEEGREGVSRLIVLFNAPSEIINKPRGFKPKLVSGEIKFKNVSFAYGDNTRPAVKNLNFKINPGCVTALVGPSGGGKTTLARLIYRHYDPQNGAIFLDDKDLRAYDLFALRRLMAIVPQEVEIFDLSVKDNIAYAKPGATFQEVKAAAKIANADEFIAKLDKGYDALVGERGIKLSGGQRQRIGIARAILANPRILIFDEATSSLDSESEKFIQDALEKISRNRTTIIIAHRLSTIKKADKIIVLENGQVAEEGSHSELAHVTGGLYAKLLNLQAMGEVD